MQFSVYQSIAVKMAVAKRSSYCCLHLKENSQEIFLVNRNSSIQTNIVEFKRELIIEKDKIKYRC